MEHLLETAKYWVKLPGDGQDVGVTPSGARKLAGGTLAGDRKVVGETLAEDRLRQEHRH